MKKYVCQKNEYCAKVCRPGTKSNDKIEFLEELVSCFSVLYFPMMSCSRFTDDFKFNHWNSIAGGLNC